MFCCSSSASGVATLTLSLAYLAPSSAVKGLPNSSSNRSWLKRSVVLLAVSEGDVYMLASVALYRSQPLSTSSMGKSPERAPHSVVMLAMANRSSTGNERIVVVSPVNSIAWFRTSSLLNNPHRATITSLPVTPSGRIPVKLTRAIGGICHHVRPVAQIEAASVRVAFLHHDLVSNTSAGGIEVDALRHDNLVGVVDLRGANGHELSRNGPGVVVGHAMMGREGDIVARLDHLAIRSAEWWEEALLGKGARGEWRQAGRGRRRRSRLGISGGSCLGDPPLTLLSMMAQSIH
ncbi:Homoaconitase [Hortaea werneckii]|nr:Homoaconitase [Hortaea werneckii]